jgi:hypothetical protein
VLHQHAPLIFLLPNAVIPAQAGIRNPYSTGGIGPLPCPPPTGGGKLLQNFIPTSRFTLHASHDGSLFYWTIDSENLKIINEYEGSNEFLVLMTLEECLGLLMLN